MNGKGKKEEENVNYLVDCIKEGNEEAFMTVIRLYQKQVFMLAYSFFRNREDALDIVQETFLRVHQKIHMFREGHNFLNWLLQMAKNLCIDTYRKNHGRKGDRFEETSLEDLYVDPVSKDAPIEDTGLEEIFSVCLKKLSKKQRLVFVLKQYNQLKYREIAQVLDIAPGTVKSLHFKAVRHLRGLVGPYLGR
ncbi:MAG: RNA polymerase sigma factor [Candidatus Aminicenantes bacterium]|nr:RNA polymerase sigma factor [Candidatus Aminicenantes bacterium]